MPNSLSPETLETEINEAAVQVDLRPNKTAAAVISKGPNKIELSRDELLELMMALRSSGYGSWIDPHARELDKTRRPIWGEGQ